MTFVSTAEAPPVDVDEARARLEERGVVIVDDSMPLSLGAIVPIELITDEDDPTDPLRLKDLTELVRAEYQAGNLYGLLTPTLVFDVIPALFVADGLHRYGTIARTLPEQYGIVIPGLRSTIRLGQTKENLRDQQIFSTNNQTNVEFPRIVNWVDEVWSLTGWGSTPRPNGYEFTATDAFRLAVKNDPRVAIRAELSTAEIDQVRAWIGEKGRIWNLKAEKVARYLAETEQLSAELVKFIRNPREGEFTFSVRHALSIHREIVDSTDYQVEAAKTVVDHELTVGQTTQLAKLVARMNEDDLVAYLVNFHPDQLPKPVRNQREPSSSGTVSGSKGSTSSATDLPVGNSGGSEVALDLKNPFESSSTLFGGMDQLLSQLLILRDRAKNGSLSLEEVAALRAAHGTFEEISHITGQLAVATAPGNGVPLSSHSKEPIRPSSPPSAPKEPEIRDVSPPPVGEVGDTPIPGEPDSIEREGEEVVSKVKPSRELDDVVLEPLSLVQITTDIKSGKHKDEEAFLKFVIKDGELPGVNSRSDKRHARIAAGILERCTDLSDKQKARLAQLRNIIMEAQIVN